jgi:hypothetical protein
LLRVCWDVNCLDKQGADQRPTKPLPIPMRHLENKPAPSFSIFSGLMHLRLQAMSAVSEKGAQDSHSDEQAFEHHKISS